MAQRTSQLVHKPYPPCDKCNCVGNACRSRFPDGEKLEWPELVGISETIAEVTISKTNNYVTIVKNYDTCPPNVDNCCNRVTLCINACKGSVVTHAPVVG
nr:hypothetical protein A4A49_28463 [Ipomoea trifida]GMC48260.1 inhibitor of trypsin and hageman factor [Ipomoea batatas]GME21574.1 inhibitor of trypsin and hageman factor [Ipomoea batatas]